MIQAKLLEMFFKALFKHPKIRGLFRYKDEPNELDIAMVELKKEIESVRFKSNAMRDLFKDIQSQIDEVKKVAHVPKNFTKDIDNIKTEIKGITTSVSGFSAIISKMKNTPILKSIFK